MTKRKKAFAVLVIAILLLILELLPYGAVLEFAHMSPDLTVGYYEQPFSYFDPIVYGYGHFGPFITAILTCLLAIVSVIHVFADHRATRMILPITSVLTFLVSLTPLCDRSFTFACIRSVTSCQSRKKDRNGQQDEQILFHTVSSFLSEIINSRLLNASNWGLSVRS